MSSLIPPPRDYSEDFSGGDCMDAVTAMRVRAARLKKKAAKWDALANALDAIEKYAVSQSKDGSEGGPHIGVGSDAEELLWELATRPVED